LGDQSFSNLAPESPDIHSGGEIVGLTDLTPERPRLTAPRLSFILDFDRIGS
jgi:hypothetical protein